MLQLAPFLVQGVDDSLEILPTPLVLKLGLLGRDNSKILIVRNTYNYPRLFFCAFYEKLRSKKNQVFAKKLRFLRKNSGIFVEKPRKPRFFKFFTK